MTLRVQCLRVRWWFTVYTRNLFCCPFIQFTTKKSWQRPHKINVASLIIRDSHQTHRLINFHILSKTHPRRFCNKYYVNNHGMIHEWKCNDVRKIVTNPKPYRYKHFLLSVKFSRDVNKGVKMGIRHKKGHIQLTNTAFSVFNPHFYRFSFFTVFRVFLFFYFSKQLDFFLQNFISQFTQLLLCSQIFLHT